MHIIAVGEGYSEGLKLIQKHFDGREYAGGKSKVRVREIKLFNFALNEEGYDEFISDFKGFARNLNADKAKHESGTSGALHGRFAKYIKYFRKFFRGITSIDEDINNATLSDFRQKLEDKGEHFLSTLMPIGRVNDAHRADGKELV